MQILDDDTTDDGAVFLVMELLEGESLDACMRRVGGRLRVVEVLAIADQVLDVLDAAHKAQIVHRDIKPANLFISKEGHVKVLDFGLARVRDGKHGAQATAMGTILGTYQYMPPEQARGKMNLIDGRTDLWALGAVMFRALANRYVHDGASANRILLQAMKDRAPKIADVAKDVPDCVARVIDTSLAYEMETRYQSAGEMQNAVREAFEELRQSGVGERTTMPSVTDEVSVEVATASTLPSLVVEMSFGGGNAPAGEDPAEETPARSTKPSAVLVPKPPPRE